MIMRSQSCVNHLVSFTSSDESIAVVNSETGVVESINAGTVTITATADNGISAECTIVVEE